MRYGNGRYNTGREWRKVAVMDNAGNRMWKCPKCGRTFKNENQSHYCGKSPETVDEYILAQDAYIREQLQRVREAIRDELPDATEKISWSMPTWWSGHNIIHFAAQKKHIGLYPGPEAVAFFSEKLDAHGFKYSKGSIFSLRSWMHMGSNTAKVLSGYHTLMICLYRSFLRLLPGAGIRRITHDPKTYSLPWM